MWAYLLVSLLCLLFLRFASPSFTPPLILPSDFCSRRVGGMHNFEGQRWHQRNSHASKHLTFLRKNVWLVSCCKLLIKIPTMLPPSWSRSLYWITVMNSNNNCAIRNQNILFFQPRFGNVDFNGKIQIGHTVNFCLMFSFMGQAWGDAFFLVGKI